MRFISTVSLLVLLVLLTGCGLEPKTPEAASLNTSNSDLEIETWRADEVPSYANYDDIRGGATIAATSTIKLIETSIAANNDFSILLEHYKSLGYAYAPTPESYRVFTNSEGVPFIGLSYNAWSTDKTFSALTSLYQMADGKALVPVYTYLIENTFTPRTAPVLTWVENGSIRKMRRPIDEEVLNAWNAQ